VKQSHAAVIRRRRLAVSTSVVAIVAVIVVLATQLPSHSSPRRQPSGSSINSQSQTSTGSSTSTSAVTPAAQLAALKSQIRSYLAKRHGSASVAVYDRVSKTLMLVHPKLRGRTASIVKVDILETRLHQTDGDLSAAQRQLATAMITESDNNAATALFQQDGGASGLSGYNEDLGLEQTEPNSAWGDTTTSAADQVTLVRELLHHSTLLTDSARRYQRHLMLNVEADQRWGISGGVPSDAVVGNKNGWLPVNEDNNLWAVNSIGWVKGEGKSYVIAVITQHDATEGYGIHTIEHVAGLVWKHATVAK
jgi:hypothetical protein